MTIKHVQMALQALIAVIFLAAGAGNLSGVMTPAIIMLGYPEYLTTFLGVMFILAIIAIYQTRFVFLQEWAWAGLMISLVGASASHMYSGFESGAPAVVLQVLVMVAYLLRHKVAQSQSTMA